MTFCFIQAIERSQGRMTYGSILTSMRDAIRSTGDSMGGGAVTTLITMLLTGGSAGGGLRQVL
jgi:metacaspase-1